jgi:acetyl-CoA carboxylase biotin carboxyl carrier protein
MPPARRRPPPPPETPDTDRRVLELTRQLAALLNEHGLAEVEMEARDLRLRVQRTASGAAAPVAAAALAPVAAPAAMAPVETEAASADLVTIEAPMVGTFYRASSPTAEPYVREGDVIKEGQILCIIEAMKLMNEIESRVAGRVARILVENGQPVEYGQALFRIEPQR